jgi:hypothetical protein
VSMDTDTDRDMDVDVDMGRFLQLNFRGFIICTKCPIVFSKKIISFKYIVLLSTFLTIFDIIIHIVLWFFQKIIS